MSDFRETLYTVDSKGNRKWVYPTEIAGFFKRRRTAVVAILLFVYLSMPWISVAGNQAIFLDIFHRRFVFFGAIFWATDTKYLLLVLATLGISLFFFTSLFGRIWCGWACPETVFLEFLFRPIEILIEGNSSARKKLDASPWNFRKVRIKALKYFAFALAAWLLSSTFLAYFVGRERLLAMMIDYPWHNWPTFLLTLALMAAFLFQFGWFREQFCTVLCPYARFQSVLLDESSLLVGYDSKRGEPRGRLNSNDKGHCVDCGLCVRVCPTGIDIRNGLQLECIQCAACADACDSVMVKIGRAPGLIRYDTEVGLKGGKIKFLRPRVVVYALILLGLLTTLSVSLISRQLSEARIFHSAKDQLFTPTPDGGLSNHFELSLANKSQETKQYQVSVLNFPEIKAVMPLNPFPLPANTQLKIPLFLNFPESLLQNGKRSIEIEVSDGLSFRQTLTLELVGPG